MTTIPAVYAAISACSAILMKDGIAKSGTATMGSKGGSYAFRGIDQFMLACAPAMQQAGLVVIPRTVDERREEREKQGNGYTSVTFYTRVFMEFDFVAISDGSIHTAKMIGEAMDSGDKATNKAMSIALKYCLMQTFMIPVKGVTIDSETENHEGIRPKAKPIDFGGQVHPWAPTKAELERKLDDARNRAEVEGIRASDLFNGFIKGDGLPEGWAGTMINRARMRWSELG